MNLLHQFRVVINHPNNKGKTPLTLGRLAWWKLNQLFFHIPAIVTLLDDTQVICEPQSSYGSFIFYVRYPEYYEMKFVENYLQSTDTFVDVGANIGALSLIAATKAPKGRIIAFEPTTA